MIINCGCIDESALASVCRTYVVLARALRLRLMGVPTCDPLGLATLATVASAHPRGNLIVLAKLFSISPIGLQQLTLHYSAREAFVLLWVLFFQVLQSLPKLDYLFHWSQEDVSFVVVMFC